MTVLQMRIAINSTIISNKFCHGFHILNQQTIAKQHQKILAALSTGCRGYFQLFKETVDFAFLS
jgi:hypothetical protein